MDSINVKNYELFFRDLAYMIAREITKQYFEAYDKLLLENRDKNRYKMVSLVGTTYKAVYGDVNYSRRYYFDKLKKRYVFLFDEFSEGRGIGLYSLNVVEMVLNACTSLSFNEAAKYITENTGAVISKTECWNIVQEMGPKIEEYLQNKIEDNQDTKKEVKILFKEADGVWLHQQLPDGKKGPKMETKLVTIFDGWKENDDKKLAGKILIGGNCSGREINKKTDAVINSIYDIDEIDTIVLNGDGASWIDSMEDANTIYQLDRFHVKKYIYDAVKHKNIRSQIFKALNEKKIDRMFDLLQTYRNSLDDGNHDKQIADIDKTITYLNNHKGNLLYYYDREGFKFPKSHEGLVYKNGGVQENQNCTIITMRMKHRRMRWSVAGSDNLIKVRCAIENGWLKDILETLGNRTILDKKLPPAEEIVKEVLSAAPFLKKIGKGSRYYEQTPISIPIIETCRTPLVEALRGLSGLSI